MVTKVLLKGELEALLRVPTTVKQAKQILERNRKALWLLKAGKNRTLKLGCPHCIEASAGLGRIRCGKCAYYRAWLDGMPCLSYTFGG